MFTGLVEAAVAVQDVRPAAATQPLRLTLANPWPGEVPALGASVAVDGCCLTVVAADATHLAFALGPETLARTTLGQLQVGHRVHVERALAVGDRLGGHLVSGHVDGVGRVVTRRADGASLHLGVQVPADVARLSAPQGSVTLAGVSLTLNQVEGDVLWVCLIPHTLAVTHLGALREGSELNCEADLLARYLQRLLRHHPFAAPARGSHAV